MGELFTFNMMSLDGFFEGPDHDISWHHVDAAFNEFAIAQLGEVSTLIFGRVTYQMMASYWPTPMALADDPVVAGLMNNTPKIVVSTTLKSADWANTSVIRDHVAETIARLKRQSEKDVAIFGSATLMSGLMRSNLINEHRVMVNPVILGSGTPLFRSDRRLGLQLTKTQTFANGNVLMCYRPDPA